MALNEPYCELEGEEAENFRQRMLHPKFSAARARTLREIDETFRRA